MEQCVIENCTSPLLAKGMCQKHYYRLARGGSLGTLTRYDDRLAEIRDGNAYIPLGIEARQGYAIVDDGFVNLEEYKWTLGTRGYPVAHIDGKTVTLHHQIVGKPPKGQVVDHINRNKLDNRTENLRFVTQRLNATNKARQKNNTSGHVGVSYNTARKKWFAQIVHNKKNKFLGHFNTLEEAVAARKAAELASPHFVEAMNLNKENIHGREHPDMGAGNPGRG